MNRVAGALLLLTAAPAAAAGTDLTGTWELEILGEDTRLEVQQQGVELRVYRRLHPEFEGRRYLLEHLYQGRLEGGTLSGDLLVREEAADGQPVDFEWLRTFAGEVLPGPILVLDGKRAHRRRAPSATASSPAATAPPAEDPPPAAEAPSAKEAPSAPGSPAPTPEEIEALAAGAPPLPIPSRRVDPDLRNLAQERRDRDYRKHIAAGDRHAGREAPAQALLEYLAAHKIDPHKVSVNVRIAETAERVGKPALALRFWRRQLRVDPESERARQRVTALTPPPESEGASP